MPSTDTKVSIQPSGLKYSKVAKAERPWSPNTVVLPDPAASALGAVVEETRPKQTSTSGTRRRQRHKGGHLFGPVTEGGIVDLR